MEAGLSRKQAWACALLLAGFAAITADVLASGPLTRLDWATHLFVQQQLQHAWWWWLASIVKHGGNEWILVPLLGALCVFAAVRYRTVRPLLVVFFVCGAIAVVIPGLKIITGRTAPHTGVDWVFTSGTEFPSGHALNAIVILGTFLELAAAISRSVERRLPPRRRYLIIVVAAAAGGLGMLALDYHWLTDVLAGWLLGAAGYIALLAWDPFRPLREARDKNLRAAAVEDLRRP